MFSDVLRDLLRFPMTLYMWFKRRSDTFYDFVKFSRSVNDSLLFCIMFYVCLRFSEMLQCIRLIMIIHCNTYIDYSI